MFIKKAVVCLRLFLLIYRRIPMLKNKKILILIFLFAGLGIYELFLNVEETVSLRLLPYPYKAAYSLCSDLDDVETVEEMRTIHKIITEEIGLRIGDTFWMYNELNEMAKNKDFDVNDNSKYFSGAPYFGISWFDGLDSNKLSSSEFIKEKILDGTIDCIHSYGHFAKGTFDRSFAEKAIKTLKENDIKIEVFVNHGGPENLNNMGPVSSQLGDNPDAKEYHSDLTLDYGIKFLWSGNMTHCIGQDGSFSFESFLKSNIEYLQDLIRNGEAIFDHSNELLNVRTLDDGNKVFDFVRYINRWGEEEVTDERSFYKQMNEDVINTLIDNGGFLIQYTHLGDNDGFPYISDETRKTLEILKEKEKNKELLVLPTSEILKYYVKQKYLQWDFLEDENNIKINIKSIKNEVEGEYTPSIDDLKGLTFYYNSDKNLEVYLGERKINVKFNLADFSGKKSVTIE